MKKIMMMAVACMVALSGSVFAQTKYDVKEAKKQAKVLAKDGWKNYNVGISIERQLIDLIPIYQNNLVFIGNFEGARSRDVAANNAMQNALEQCVRLMDTEITGVNASVQGTLNEATINDMTTQAKALFEGRIAEGMRLHLRLVQEMGNGAYAAQVYCYIDKKIIEEMKTEYQKAAEDATKNAKATGDHLREVSKNIDEAHGNK